MTGAWEERWHPLREEWVIVAAHRQHRPWIGEVMARPARTVPAFDPSCTFCPGNTRVSGATNPAYERVFVFDNDHPCVGPDAPSPLPSPPGFYQSRPARGIARVVCYTPRHDLTLASWARMASLRCSPPGRSSIATSGRAPGSRTCSSSRTRARWSG